MNKYLVTATQVVNYELEVEAESEEAAIEVAEKVSNEAFDEFIEVGYEFTVDEAEEIN